MIREVNSIRERKKHAIPHKNVILYNGAPCVYTVYRGK